MSLEVLRAEVARLRERTASDVAALRSELTELRARFMAPASSNESMGQMATPQQPYRVNRSAAAPFTCAVGHRRLHFASDSREFRTYCNLSADGCMCSGPVACSSSWSCRASKLCTTLPPPPAASPPASVRAAFLLFLAFNRSLIRSKFAARPHAAYDRELQRILWFVKSARRVKTTVPIHVVVGPERDEKKEALLLKQGVRVTVGPVVEPPRWASKYHRLTFSKLGALALTQFDKVFVFDNDMALVANVCDACSLRRCAPGMLDAR